MKISVSFVLVLLFSRFASAEVDQSTWTPRSPLEFPTSFHSQIMSSKENPVQKSIGTLCVSAIQKFIKGGGDFSSPLMESTYTTYIAKSQSAFVRKNTFFHYTPSTQLIEIAKQKKFERIFEYLRSKPTNHQWLFYVAADPNSSSDYGPIRLTFTLRTGGKIFTPHEKAGSLGTDKNHFGDLAVQLEQGAKNSTLGTCYEKRGPSHHHPILTLLAAEANHIDLIAYLGERDDWHQLLGVWAIQDMKATWK